ncbi:MAG: hypothetical protein KGM91_08600 [Burkholderiales bacterium]|nr:hypothetical protein [Burkholderiales bacterium]
MSRPTKDEGPTVAAVAPQESKRIEKPDCHGAPHAGQALRVIEGEAKATQYLARLQAQQADPDELALIVSMLYGAALRGFCRAIEKALGVRHG